MTAHLASKHTKDTSAAKQACTPLSNQAFQKKAFQAYSWHVGSTAVRHLSQCTAHLRKAALMVSVCRSVSGGRHCRNDQTDRKK
eukprot:1160657-Pelagomonas_calceolata.AAC.4